LNQGFSLSRFVQQTYTVAESQYTEKLSDIVCYNYCDISKMLSMIVNLLGVDKKQACQRVVAS